MSKEYLKLQQDYGVALAKSKQGDGPAKADKSRIMRDIRQMERESARAGRVLNPIHRGNGINVDVTETPTKRSLQEEYVRRFNSTDKVLIENRDGTKFEGTLRDFHSARLLKR